MGNFFGRIIRFFDKTFFIGFTILTIILVVIFHQWLFVQSEHVISYYYVYAGDSAFRKGKLQDAINQYNRALRLYPEHTNARYNLGNIYVAYEDYNSAASCYQQALQVSPDFFNARINLGIILSEELLDIDQAIVEYQKVIQSDPFIINIPFVYSNVEHVKNSKALALYNMGLAYKAKSLLAGANKELSRHFLEKAVECYRQSIKIAPDSYDTHYNLALTLHLLSDYTEALDEYCKSLALDPLSYETHYNLAMLLRTEKKYQESIKELEKAGLLLDSKGEGYKTRYIYQVLNDVSQRAVLQRDYNANDKSSNLNLSDDIIYVNGKAELSEKLGQSFYNYMRSCSSCDYINNK